MRQNISSTDKLLEQTYPKIQPVFVKNEKREDQILEPENGSKKLNLIARGLATLIKRHTQCNDNISYMILRLIWKEDQSTPPPATKEPLSFFEQYQKIIIPATGLTIALLAIALYFKYR